MMLTCAPARQEELDDLLGIIYHQDNAGLRPLYDLVQLTWDNFSAVFRSSGQVYCLRQDGRVVGACWVELRGEVLYLYGINVCDGCRGQGIGSWALAAIENVYRERAAWIELWVHASNRQAKKLYERCGYQALEQQAPGGFYVMRKPIGSPPLLH